jgi:polyvinyl alcohol dehydrogenase (cytochrome)
MRSLLFVLLAATTVFAQDGAAVYKTHCAMCHDSSTGRIPSSSTLRTKSSASILQALNAGLMKTQAAGLSNEERTAVADYLGSKNPTPIATLPASAFCSAPPQRPAKKLGSTGWVGWGANDENTRFVNTKAAGMTASDVPQLKLLWAFGLGDGTEVRSQAAIAGDHVYVANLKGQVFSLDKRTGCIQWTFDGGTPVRSGIVLGPSERGGKINAVYFGDQAANVYSLDASTGKLRWDVHVADHFAAFITGTPRLHAGVLYVPVSSYEELLAESPTYPCCTFRGSVIALDAATGKTIWKTDTISDPPHSTEKSKNGTQLQGPSGAAIWSSPTYDDKLNVMYVSTGDNYSNPATKTSDAVLCLDAETGKLLWSKQVTPDDVFNMGPLANGRDFDFGQPPILVKLPGGHRALVIGQKSGLAYALDPDRQGQLLWQKRLGEGGSLGGIQWGSSADRANMYVAVSDIRFNPVADKSSPMGYRFQLDAKHGGGLFALRLDNGTTAWKAEPASCGDRKQCSPAQSAAVTTIPGVVFSGSVDGHLRAYSASTGQVIWDVDTAREFKTANGLSAKGGSLDASGPVVSGGILLVNSGYGQWGGLPGNVLLAFSVAGRSE